MATREASAVGLRRYAVLTGQRVIVAEGIEMTVRSGFMLRGVLVLDGLLRVEG
ncbi:MAG: hypothetical protein N2483_10265 [Burkholderiaceae bacterium]|nr:hypothetical protein [Burkholderiaceae bacterium]